MIKCFCGGEIERRKANFFTPQHLLIIQSFVYILRHPNLQPELVSLGLRANKRFHSLRKFRRNEEFSWHNFEDVFFFGYHLSPKSTTFSHGTAEN